MSKANRGSGVPAKLLERLSEDEGITSGIADDEAGLLFDAIKKELANAADAEASYATVVARGRRLAKVISAWCYDGEPDEAKRLWTEAGGKGTLDGVSTDDAVAAMKNLLAREGLGRD
jgi:hypothetical protein